jgi:signal transduction histidine kinase
MKAAFTDRVVAYLYSGLQVLIGGRNHAEKWRPPFLMKMSLPPSQLTRSGRRKMKKSERDLRAKTDSMTKDLQAIAVRLRYLTSPMSAIKIYIEGILEDDDSAETGEGLKSIDKAANRCIEITRELLDLTMRYFDPGQD